MAFDDIERVAAAPAQVAIPHDGLRVSSRAAAARGVPTRYIRIDIGAGLAKALCLHGEQSSLRLRFGSGSDAGKIGLSVDVEDGAFPAKKSAKGIWSLTINAASADGLFALEFPKFTVSEPEIVEKGGKPPMAVFSASEAMLAVED